MAMDILDCFTTEPKEMDFVIPNFLAGVVGVMAAAGGVGKSFWSLEVAMGICSHEANKSLLNLDIPKHGRVVILNAEDPATVLHHRIHSIGSYLNESAREEVAEKLLIEPLMGKQVNIRSQRWQEAVLRVMDGSRFTIFDTLTRWHNADENSNGEMSEVLGTFEMLCDKTGSSVLLLHHVSKAMAANGRQDEQQATRGAAAITDNARWQGWMQVMGKEEAGKYGIAEDIRKRYVNAGGNKENYGQNSKDVWLERCRGGVLLPVDLKPVEKPSVNGTKRIQAQSGREWGERSRG
jgi:RecA-family ATPase